MSSNLTISASITKKAPARGLFFRLSHRENGLFDPRGDHVGQLIKIVGKGATGKGATGNGANGYEFTSSHRTELRRAFNKVSSRDGRWLCYVFDQPSDAVPLEGGSGSGDSGGPVLVQSAKDWLLAGLASWSDPQSSARTPGKYGQITCNVRLSHYRDWIDSVISAVP